MIRPAPGLDLGLLQEWLKHAGQIAISQQNTAVPSIKPDNTLVTGVDHLIETFLTEKISDLYPTHGVISEEGVLIKGESAYTWVIDPLDGTRVYYAGLPIWGISVGIMYHNRARWGILHLPKLNEMYVGMEKNAFLNGETLSAVIPQDLDSPMTFLAVPSQCHSLFDIKIRRLRSFGSLAAHLAYVARGSAIGAVTQHTSIWDIAAMLPILTAVGVTAKYLSGKELRLSDLVTGPTAEVLVFAHSDIIDTVRERITLKKPIRATKD